MKKLKIAVVGLGRIGWGFHLPRIKEHAEQYQLAAVVDLSQERLDEAKEVYGANGYMDLADMINAEHPDVVVVCSPTHLHPEHACKAMEMGCDVFLDKPMAIDYESAQKIADCAKATGRKLMVYQPHRTFGEPNEIKSIIESGKIGKPNMIRFASSSYNRRNDWQSLKKFGGGMLNNYGAHFIDAMLYICGSSVRRLNCVTQKIVSAGDADDVVKAVFVTDNDIILDLTISQASAIPMEGWTAFGPYGAATCESVNGKSQVRLRYYDPASIPAAVTSESLAAANRKYSNDVEIPWVEETIPIEKVYAIDFYQKCYEYFAEDKAPFVPVEETLNVMRLIAECHADAEK